MALALGLLAALTVGLSDLFGRRVTVGSTPLTAAASMQAFATLVAGGFALATASPFAGAAFAYGCLSGLGMGTALGSYYYGMQHSTSTIVSPLAATLSAVIPIGYAATRGDSVSVLTAAGAGIAIVGLAAITSGAVSKDRLRAGLIWGTLAGCSYGFAASSFVEAASSDSWWPGVGQRGMAFVLLSSVAIAKGVPAIAPRPLRRDAVLSGVMAGVTTVSYLGALAIDPTLGVIALATFPAFSVVVGRIFFGDSVQPRQVAGITLVIVGVAAAAAG